VFGGQLIYFTFKNFIIIVCLAKEVLLFLSVLLLIPAYVCEYSSRLWILLPTAADRYFHIGHYGQVTAI
jgi:hypothetical protein